MAIQLYLEGVGLRATGRVIGGHGSSVMRWVCKAAEFLSEPNPKAALVVKVDELCAKIGEKNEKFGFGLLYARSREGYWVSKLVVGERKLVESF
ncbi:MAG: hypothetical protein SFT81_00035 [Candidatus Caenarcaniphilales bacterium]|nr:hypothetical protein [Candidatus Caenarcaniphilales bacterium]